MIEPEIIGYYADLTYKPTDSETVITMRRWCTRAERLDLIGDGRIVSGCYLPLVRAYDLTGRTADAWLIEGIGLEPYITDNRMAVTNALEAGADSTSLKFAGKAET